MGSTEGSTRPLPKKRDAAPRVRRADDRITCNEAAAAGLEKPLGARPQKDIERLAPALSRLLLLPSLLCLLSDDKQKLAFINAMYFKKNQGTQQ